MENSFSGAQQAERKSRRCVLLTGTSGFLGSNLLKRLRRDERYGRVIAVDIQKPSVRANKAKYYRVDITHPRADEMLYEIMSGEKPDTVVHTGFFQRPIEDTTYGHEVNSIGTMHILSACAESAIRKIVVGSRTLVYGAHYDNPHYMNEDYMPRPRLDYEFQIDKAEVERQLLRFWKANPNTLVTVLRHCSIMGPSVTNCWTRYLSMSACPTILGYNPLIQFISEEDALDAFKLAIDEDYHGVFNIVGLRAIPLKTILKLANKIPLPMPFPIAENFFRALWITKVGPFPPENLDFLRYHCLVDGSRAKEVMGFEAKKTAWQALEEFLEVKRLGRVGRRVKPDEEEEEVNGEESEESLNEPEILMETPVE